MNTISPIFVRTGYSTRAILLPSKNLVSILKLPRARRGIPFAVLYPRSAYNKKLLHIGRPTFYNNSSSSSSRNLQYSTFSPPSNNKMAPTIELNENEEKIRRILLDVAEEIDAGAQEGTERLVLRITGGWVRDKLLKGRSNDIDIGINNMTGFDFASKLNEVLAREKDKYGIDARTVHKIESNPDKSKHLETATTKVIDLFIDFVNLRSESYTAESRIPQMKFGTPKEDALRRDATVNALFYNLHTQQVEDFTESGLEDMEKKIIRTPLAPFETFSDDPLRVLRLIRFASRLQFHIAEDVQEAMSNAEIKKALKLKISRERIGVEVEKMLLGDYPFGSIMLFHSLGFFDAVFSPPELELEPERPREHLNLAAHELNYLLRPETKERFPRISGLLRDKNEEYIAWVVCCLAPWAGQSVLEKNRPMPTAAAAARSALKMKTKDITIIRDSFSKYEDIKSMVIANSTEPFSRSKIGLTIRMWGADWRLQVFSSLLLELIPKWELNLEKQGQEVEKILQRYEELLERVNSFGLEDANDLKPILNGKELTDALKRKPGIWTKDALDCVVEWQLDHPDRTKEEAMEYLLSDIAPKFKG